MPEHRPNREVQAAEIVSQIIRARRARAELFRPDLFSDPAWDMLLVLFVASVREQIVTATELANATATSIPSAVRWIDVLQRDGLLQRKPEPASLGPDIVELGGRGMEAICDWIENCGLASSRTSEKSAGENEEVGVTPGSNDNRVHKSEGANYELRMALKQCREQLERLEELLVLSKQDNRPSR